MNAISRRKGLLFIIMVVASTVIASFEVTPQVYADIPDVTAIMAWTSGTNTILNITVRHASPTSSHYIYKVEVDVAGTVDTVNLTPQSATIFVVQYNMGNVTTIPTVRARAFCTVHGVGPWFQLTEGSGGSEVSGFPVFTIILVGAIASIAIVLVIALLLLIKFHRFGKRTAPENKRSQAINSIQHH